MKHSYHNTPNQVCLGMPVSQTYYNSPQRQWRLLAFLICCLFTGLSAQAQTADFFVKVDGNDANAGTSWNSAFATIQAAVDAATAGDEIWVAAGVYYPTELPVVGSVSNPTSIEDLTIFIDEDVRLFGGFEVGDLNFSDRDILNNRTILSGAIPRLRDLDLEVPVTLTAEQLVRGLFSSSIVRRTGSALLNVDLDTVHVNHIMVTQNLTNQAIIDGFEFRDARSALLEGVAPLIINGEAAARTAGRGILNLPSSSPTISNNRFINNVAKAGKTLLQEENLQGVLDQLVVQEDTETLLGLLTNVVGAVLDLVSDLLDVVGSLLGLGGGGDVTIVDISADLSGGDTLLAVTTDLGRGGAIFNGIGSEAQILACEFIGNVADLGGAIFNDNSADIRIDNSLFEANVNFREDDLIGNVLSLVFDNSMPLQGGAIFNDLSADLTLNNNIFDSNSSLANASLINGNLAIDAGDFAGGAIFNNGFNEVTMTANTLRNNVAAAGGALFNGEGVEIMIDDCLFFNNSCQANGTLLNATVAIDAEDFAGGAIFSDRAIVNILNSDFLNNNAITGGALFSRLSDLDLSDLVFDGNRALLRDTLLNSTIVLNGGENLGGAMFNLNTNTLIQDTRFLDNIASRGGAIFSKLDSLVVLNSVLDGNEASLALNLNLLSGGADGGAMFLENTVADLINVLMFDNLADARGGAVFNLNADTRLLNTTLTTNEAGVAGAALVHEGIGVLDVINSILWNNQVLSNGSIIDLVVNAGASAGGGISFDHSIVQTGMNNGSWNLSLGVDLGNNQDADPSFLNVATNDFGIDSTSIAFNAGNTARFNTIVGGLLGGTVNDILGNTRLQGDIDLGPIEVNLGIGLPVEWLSFTGEAVNQTAHLAWSTATEENNEGYNIQRSTNGLDWQNIGFMRGQGTTLSTSRYTYIDESPLAGVNYYRLQQRDYDGAVDYSDIVTVRFDQNGQNPSFFPNPTANGFIQLSHAIGTVRILDVTGKMVKEVQVTDPTQTLNLGELARGQYYLQCLDAQGGLRSTLPLIKQ